MQQPVRMCLMAAATVAAMSAVDAMTRMVVDGWKSEVESFILVRLFVLAVVVVSAAWM